jgi:hypothetical protein
MKNSSTYPIPVITIVFSFLLSFATLFPYCPINEAVAQPVQIYPQYDATLHISVKGASPDTGRMLIGVFGMAADNLTQPITSYPALVDIGKMAQKHQTDQLEIGIFNFTVGPVLGGHMNSCLFIPESNFTESRCNNVGLATQRDSYDVIVDITGFKE